MSRNHLSSCYRHQRHVRPRFDGVQDGGDGHARGPHDPSVRTEGERCPAADQALRLGSEDHRQVAERVLRVRRAGDADGHVQQVRRDGQVADGAFRRVYVPAPPTVQPRPSEAVDIAFRRSERRLFARFAVLWNSGLWCGGVIRGVVGEGDAVLAYIVIGFMLLFFTQIRTTHFLVDWGIA